MASSLTILHTPECPHTAVLAERLTTALARLGGPAPAVAVEEVTDADDAARRSFHGSPALLVDGVDAFAGPESPTGFSCRTYRTEAGVEGSPSVDQIVAALGGAGR